MSQNKLFPKLIPGILVAIFFGIALYLRISLPYNQVFAGEHIKFTGVDAWFHMRLVDNLLHNFPHRISFDPYGLYPGGMGLEQFPPTFTYFLASLIWLIGLGSPTQHTIDLVGVYFPAVLGAATVISVYFIGKEVFNRWVGVIGAGLIALSPGEFLGRSILGFTDHHAAEVLFTTIAVLFLIMAIKSARQRQLTFASWRRWQWAIVGKPLLYSLLAGIFLGIYLLTWAGALLFVFIFFVYFIAQFVIDHLKGKSTDYLCLVSTVTFITALIVFLPASPGKMLIASPIIAFLTPLALWALSFLMVRRELRPAYYPIAVLGLGIASLIVFRFLNPGLLKAILSNLYMFTWTTKQTILEAQPLLFPNNVFSWFAAWGNFTTGFFLSLISIGILIYLITKRGEADKNLLLIWSLVILALALAQRRFAYYYAINIALLTGYFSWQILRFAGFKEPTAQPSVEPQKLKAKKAKTKPKKPERKFRLTARHFNMGLAVIVVFFLAFFPNIGRATAVAKQPRFAPDDAWFSSLTWLRANTPEPFGSPEFYYQLYQTPFKYPASAYGIAAWWDYGYWITRIGHRIPNCNPGGGASGAIGSFFLSQDEASGNKILDELGSRYVIVDYDIVTTKFWAVATLSGKNSEEFSGIYYVTAAEGKLQPQIFFYPEYYRSLLVRLYCFDGDEFIPKGSTAVISYQDKVSPEGRRYKQMTSFKPFPDYESAQAYIKAQKSGNYHIVATNIFASPVPLEKIEHYKLVYSSEASIKISEDKTVPKIKIFEYVK